ncbi:MAG TPA: TIGR03667 family PPOX class F420-dependent oxidoreductase [Anaerolineales bacterium]|jgi:PPOX class probable F420-dependent enzyme|nr:TIGR03667 family PPOX class F420-dependent oxidoreductase [Anaerolineales bacterium]
MLNLESKFGVVVKEHLENEYFIWMTTVDSSGTPQPRPVWFIWEDDSFLIYSEPNTYKVKHLENNSNVSLHFNTKDNKADEHIIIFSGEASFDKNSPPAHNVPAYFEKYKIGFEELNLTPEGFSSKYSKAIRIKPTKVRGWE